MVILDSKEQRKRIEYALRCVGLFKFKNKKVRNLSGGQMQRVSIARALVKNCDIIIADEPTGNVDSENTIQIMNILKKISEKKLVLLVTHELNIARFYSDRIIQIKDGKIISDGEVVNRGKLNTQTDRGQRWQCSHQLLMATLRYFQAKQCLRVSLCGNMRQILWL